MNELDVEAVADRPVSEVMIHRPKALPADATVADARSMFANPKVLVVPLVDGDGRVTGELGRDDVPASADAAEHAADYSSDPHLIAPDATMRAAIDTLTELDGERLVVVDGDGRLAGMLCLNRSHGRFCVDDGVRPPV
jgi:CBS domain-containing protein